jgi:hypothetical protein
MRDGVGFLKRIFGVFSSIFLGGKEGIDNAAKFTEENRLISGYGADVEVRDFFTRSCGEITKEGFDRESRGIYMVEFSLGHKIFLTIENKKRGINASRSNAGLQERWRNIESFLLSSSTDMCMRESSVNHDYVFQRYLWRRYIDAGGETKGEKMVS